MYSRIEAISSSSHSTCAPTDTPNLSWGPSSDLLNRAWQHPDKDSRKRKKLAQISNSPWTGRTLVESAQGSDLIRSVAGATRTVSPEVKTFADTYKLRLAESFDALLKDSNVQAVVLCTPHSMHTRQVVAAAQAGKHVFCEKPFALSKRDAERAVDATRKAGVTLGLGRPQVDINSHCDAVFRPHPSPQSFKILTFISSDFGVGGGNDETAQACTVALDISVLDGIGYVQLHRVSAGNRRKR